MVKWKTIDERISKVNSFNIKATKVLDTPWNKESYDVVVNNKETTFDFDLSKLLSPILGSFWRVLYAEGDFDSIKDALRKYWAYKQIPIIDVDVVEAGSGAQSIVGTRLISNPGQKSVVNVNEVITAVNKGFSYDRVVVGVGDISTEFQFLNSSNRVTAKVNDFIDPGLFISVNGGVKIAAGVNRLVCTNGLVKRMYAWEGNNYKFNNEILERATTLANWLVDQQGEHITSIRKLSVIMHEYPKPMITKFWKEWSQKIELNQLTWYDVIDDITNYANKYLNKTRYQILQFPVTLKKYQEKVTCPVCSSGINGGK